MITVVAVILTEKENGTFQTIKRLTLDPSVAGSNSFFKGAHFLFLAIISGLVTSLPVPLYPSLGVTEGLCQVSWHWDNSSVPEDLTSCSMGSLPVL